ncbi:MAG: rcp1 2 [Bacteroidetes bacterium]|jgi:CheY-like chemotaxis protein|nr:rcp1 2 [Bacteroidota bacterium]
MPKKLHFLLADDDSDDRLFFEMVLNSLPEPTQLRTVQDGEELMEYLKKTKTLPDVLFLDINMPRKNGAECLVEIKKNEKLKNLPVVIYSTSLHPEMADKFYENGAHYYIKKGDLEDLEKILKKMVTIFSAKEIIYPKRNDFILTI